MIATDCLGKSTYRYDYSYNSSLPKCIEFALRLTSHEGISQDLCKNVEWPEYLSSHCYVSPINTYHSLKKFVVTCVYLVPVEKPWLNPMFYLEEQIRPSFDESVWDLNSQ